MYSRIGCTVYTAIIIVVFITIGLFQSVIKEHCDCVTYIHCHITNGIKKGLIHWQLASHSATCFSFCQLVNNGKIYNDIDNPWSCTWYQLICDPVHDPS